jgi:transposase-like protein
MLQRGGEIAIRMPPDVKQKTIAPLIKAAIAPGSVVSTDEYDINARLQEWGYAHHTVRHAGGEFARDGHGSCEVHVDRVEGFWSLLRSCLRPHRGISQERLPLYLGFIEFIHNARRRGKALLGSLVELLVAPRNPG